MAPASLPSADSRACFSASSWAAVLSSSLSLRLVRGAQLVRRGVVVLAFLLQLLARRGQRDLGVLHLDVANDDAGLDGFGDLLAIQLGARLDVGQLQLALRDVGEVAALVRVAVLVELQVRLVEDLLRVIELGGAQLGGESAAGRRVRRSRLDQLGGGAVVAQALINPASARVVAIMLWFLIFIFKVSGAECWWEAEIKDCRGRERPSDPRSP